MSNNLIKTPRGYIAIEAITRFYVLDAPGQANNGYVFVVLRSEGFSPPEHFNTRMYESEFLKAYNEVYRGR